MLKLVHRSRGVRIAASLVGLALALAACSAADNGSGGGAAAAENVPDVGKLNTYTLPDVPDTGKTFKAAAFVAQQQQGDAISYTQALKEYGAKHGLDVDIYDAGGYANIDKQINQIRTALTTHPDVMLVWATDPNAVVPALTEAAAQGVKIINWIVPSAYGGAVSSIHTDFVQDSYNLTKAIGETFGGEGKIVTAFGGCGGSYQRDLQAGADKAAADNPGLSIAVKECPSDFDPSKVQETVANALVSQPDVKAVLTSVVSQAVGAVNAIQASHAEGHVTVGSGILTSCDDVKLVKNGRVSVVSGIPSAYMGRLGAVVAIRALAGEPVDPTYVVPGNVYTAKNIDDADLTNDLTAQFLKGC
ncbi:MAG: hypothetical protein JWO67_5077 [Streptosporangiaceae bacterium]|nr:hypothetical protein [Streptosporangiaceae bacterium]